MSEKTETAAPRNIVTLADAQAIMAFNNELIAALRIAYEAGFEDAACGGGTVSDEERADALVKSLAEEAWEGALRWQKR